MLDIVFDYEGKSDEFLLTKEEIYMTAKTETEINLSTNNQSSYTYATFVKLVPIHHKQNDMREINFQNVNLLNSRANMLSGNLLPMAGDDSFPIFWRIYRAIVWSIELIHAIALIAGIIVTPKEKALKDGIISVVVIIEASFLLTSIYARKKLTMQVIQKMNDILRTADGIMEDIVKTTLKPIILPFIIYGVASVISVTIWTIHPIVLVFKKTTFFYVDYNLPAAFSPEPFSVSVLIPSTIIMTMGGVYLFLRKYSLDVYMMHLVLMLTAQYRYTAKKLSLLFQYPQNDSNNVRKNSHLVTDEWLERELRTLCRHQNNVLSYVFLQA
ncbi:odorant receptor 170 [Lasius niger]|uniref:Odorant receptor 170 n=1 Tax=Lasius niger TaxID=67767 RepID=A0A0J7KD72_LASNI|nr:odorant receptor 170 [Lasius niger]